MPPTLRPYEPADFEILYSIDRACYPSWIAYSRRELRAFLTAAESDCLVSKSGAAAKSEILGFLIAETEGAEGHIVTLDVIESQRRKGIGTILLTEMEKRLAIRGVRRMLLETATSNEAGIAFWQRHGYRSLGIVRGYYAGRLDAYQMDKTLTL
jgi:ribosomal protein S18 acetylase RimI-like enzyme